MSLRLPLVVLAALILPVSAQTTKPSGKAESGLTLRLLADEVREGQTKVFLQSAAAKSEAVDLPTTAFSPSIAVSARTLALKSADSDATLCDITLPAQGKSFGVLLAPEKTAGYQPIVVRLDDPDFKAGDVFFVNRSDKTVVVKLGATELVLEAGKSSKSRPTNAVDNTYYDVVISERNATGDKLVSSTRWPLDAHLRSYVFLSANARGRVTFRAVDEHPEATGGKKKR